MVTESEARAIYKSAIHFDGLNICNFSREIFEAWHQGGITGVFCTAGIWENFRDSIKNVVQRKKWFEEHSDLIIQAHNISDIRRAKKEGKTAVLLSWQNTAGIEDQLDFLKVFRDLGVRKMQLTYNTQNYSGAGYTELNDSGLTGFGREVVTEMAKLGIVCDLSHLGPQTCKDVIAFAPEGRPPCFSHILPAGLCEHPRNKSDELIVAIGKRGGFVGLSQFGRHMKRGNESTIHDYVEALDYVIGLVGEDLVGVGSDSSEGHGRPRCVSFHDPFLVFESVFANDVLTSEHSEFMAWCNMDKDYAGKLTPWGSQKVVKPLGPLAEREKLAEAMARAGWSEVKMRKVLRENWLKYLEKIFGS